MFRVVVTEVGQAGWANTESIYMLIHGVPRDCEHFLQVAAPV